MTIASARSALTALLTTLAVGAPHVVIAAEAPPAPWTVVHAGLLLAAPPQPPKSRQSLLIRGDRIVEIRDGFVDPATLQVAGQPAPRRVDLSDRFVLPGLLDGHVHLSFQSGASPTLAYRQSDSEQALTTLLFARRTLAAGFTTVRDLASGPEIVYAVRNALAAGRFIGPRILASGLPVTARGGHGDFPGSREDLWQDAGVRQSGVCWDEGSCRDAVRLQLKRGSNVIKLMASGGFSSGTGVLQQLTFEEMKAAVDAAHMRGVRVTTHAYAPAAIADAVRAGVDSVEHGIGLDDRTAIEMARRGTFLSPTLMVFEPPAPSGAAPARCRPPPPRPRPGSRGARWPPRSGTAYASRSAPIPASAGRTAPMRASSCCSWARDSHPCRRSPRPRPSPRRTSGWRARSAA